jgi:O-antigen ligase
MSLFFYLRNRNFGFFVIIVSTILSVLALLGMLQKGPLAQFLYKTSVTIRGYYWDAGVSMFLSNPFTGIGMDSYGLYFKEFRNPEYPLLYGFEITSSNAHNIYIQLFATAGIFVGLIYLLLNLYIFRQGVLLVLSLDSEKQKIALILLSAWVGFQAQSIISIDNICQCLAMKLCPNYAPNISVKIVTIIPARKAVTIIIYSLENIKNQ